MLDTVLVSFILLLVKLFGSVFYLTGICYIFKKRKTCPPITNKILLQPAKTLTKMIAYKEVTSEKVVTAYIERIKTVNPIINAVVQDRFDLAINEAKILDNLIETTNLSPEDLLTYYPLLGVPITIKESIAVAGCSNASGKVFPEGRIATKDAPAIELCKNAGAIPLLVSNTPELSANFETHNNVTGRTLNPYDNRKTAGGSSGGEGALLGAGASIVGLGSDIYGSLRLPAHFCGVWGHKPSPRTVPVEGHYPLSKHIEEWKEFFSFGPMTRYAKDLPLVLSTILDKSNRTQLNLNEKVDLTTIKFYHMIDKASVLTTTLENDVDKMIKQLIHHLSLSYPSSVKKLNSSLFKYAPESSMITILSCDDVEGVFENKGKSWLNEFVQYTTCRSKTTFVIVLLHLIKRLVSILPLSTIKKYKMNIATLKEEMIKVLGSDGVLIVPCFPSAAHYPIYMFSQLMDYSLMGIFNCIGFPVTTCPLGLNDQGLPVGVQVVAAPHNDRLTLAVAEEIEKVLGGWVPPSG